MSPKKVSLTVALLFVVAGCEARPRGAPTANDAINITKPDMEAHWPRKEVGELIIATADGGDRWKVSYEIPGGSTGSPITYEVDKKSGKIVDVYGPR